MSRLANEGNKWKIRPSIRSIGRQNRTSDRQPRGSHGGIVLSDILDAAGPYVRFFEAETPHLATGITGDAGFQAALAYCGASGLLRLDSPIGRLSRPTEDQLLGLLRLQTRLARFWLDPEDGALWLQGRAVVRQLGAAELAVSALARDFDRTLSSSALADVLGTLPDGDFIVKEVAR
jgi:hypothetical protein